MCIRVSNMSWKKKTKKYCAMSLIGDYLSTENNSQALEYTNDCLSSVLWAEAERAME